MNHLGIFETPKDMDNGIHLSDMSQKPITQSFALTGPFDKSGDVHKFYGGGCNPTGMKHIDQAVKAGIRNFYHPHVGINRGERIIADQSLCGGQGREERGLTHIRKTYNAAS